MDIKKKITNIIADALSELDIDADDIELEHPAELEHGDYATNVALKTASKNDLNPRTLSEQIVEEIQKDLPSEIKSVESAGPGFINIHLAKDFYMKSIAEITESDEMFGSSTMKDGEKTMIEYTDPNPFKVFHIGHLMSNILGEALSRIIESQGAEVKRACYQGDVGMHVAKSIWGVEALGKGLPEEDVPLFKQVAFWGEAYAKGAQQFEEDERVAEEIKDINTKIYDQSDEAVNALYEWGRQVSLDYFETIYERLGTEFDFYFFESETGEAGKKVVSELVGDVFVESEGAIVFKGEEYDLHTRVFVNSEGLPTYEAKELGLAKLKFDEYPYDTSIVITGNEVNDYFRVLLKAMEFVYPDLQEKTEHIGHGMLRLPEGKMSSRTGNVVAAEELLEKTKKKVEEKMDSADKVKDISEDSRGDIIEAVAIAAIKYSILKQNIGKDVVFDMDQALSFEGDSGPYLQYTAVRARSVLQKAMQKGIEPAVNAHSDDVVKLERLLYRYPYVVAESAHNREPHTVAQYLTRLAGVFNAYYNDVQIIDDDPETGYRVALTQAVNTVLENGLELLGIEVPERM